MKFSWNKSLIIGICLIIIFIFSSIAGFNILIKKVPLQFQDPPINVIPLYKATTDIKWNKVSTDYSVPNTSIISEDQAWKNAWAFYQKKMGMTMFLPMKKYSSGLYTITDENKTQFLAWNFDVMQNDRRFLIEGCNHGGRVFVDAYTGKIIYFFEVC